MTKAMLSNRYTHALKRLAQLTWSKTSQSPNHMKVRHTFTSHGNKSTSRIQSAAFSSQSLPEKANALTKMPRTAYYLGLSGAIPFITGAVACNITADPYIFARATQLYGTSVLSFLGAVHWGVALRSSINGVAPRRDFIYGVIPSLLGWSAALMQPAEGLIVLATGFTGAFLYDMVRFGSGSEVPAWYRRLRLPLSVAAVGGCVVAFSCMRRAEGRMKGECTRHASIVSTSTLEMAGLSSDDKDD